MTRAEVFCDRCKVRIEAKRGLVRVETGPLRDRLPMFDLCERCQAALLSWIDDVEQREVDPIGATCEK